MSDDQLFESFALVGDGPLRSLAAWVPIDAVQRLEGPDGTFVEFGLSNDF